MQADETVSRFKSPGITGAYLNGVMLYLPHYLLLSGVDLFNQLKVNVFVGQESILPFIV